MLCSSPRPFTSQSPSRMRCPRAASQHSAVMRPVAQVGAPKFQPFVPQASSTGACLRMWGVIVPSVQP